MAAVASVRSLAEPTAETPLVVRAVASYYSADAGDLSFAAGDIVYITVRARLLIKGRKRTRKEEKKGKNFGPRNPLLRINFISFSFFFPFFSVSGR